MTIQKGSGKGVHNISIIPILNWTLKMTTQCWFIGCTEYGIDKMYTELQGKVSCMWLYNATDGEAPAGGDQWCPLYRQEHLSQETLSGCIQEHNSYIQWNVLYTSIVVKLELCDLTPLVQELSFFGLKQLMEVFQLVRWRELFREWSYSGSDKLLILDVCDELAHSSTVHCTIVW